MRFMSPLDFLRSLKNGILRVVHNFKIFQVRTCWNLLNILYYLFAGRLEKFLGIHAEMNCLKVLDLRLSGTRELPSSLLYMTGLEQLYLCNNRKLWNKSQMWKEEDIPSAKLRPACNSFNNFSGPTGFLCLTRLDLRPCSRIKVELDSWM